MTLKQSRTPLSSISYFNSINNVFKSHTLSDLMYVITVKRNIIKF